MRKYVLIAYAGCLSIFPSKAQNKDFENFVGQIGWRNIGPAKTSGRISDIAVNPKNHSEYYIASAYGGVWKTENSGTTFMPIFDGYGTQSIGSLAIHPINPNIVWVGTGENNNQRSVGYGNGLYFSEDAGKSFTKVKGVFENSQSIAKIVINPTNPSEMWVAAYGPLWSAGGERGIYYSSDAGKTWTLSLFVSKHTGFNEVHIDPSNNNILYATAHQRRRHEWTYLSGGPESAIYRSVDHGKTWQKCIGGFPSGDLGRISLTTSNTESGRVTAIVEAEGKKGGVYTSSDFGVSWTRINDFQTAGNYYQEVFSDPANGKRLFFMDTYLHFSEDGGKNIKRYPEDNKHVDNHAIWINPSNSNHLLVGCDGGLYETFDNGSNWIFKENLPITQFYRVSVDNSTPFYNVYGGTQDNFSLGGPSRNKTSNGIGNDEWFVTVGGDGFKSQIDPTNPDIVYAQWQYGGLIRHNRKTGESIDIRPNFNDPSASALRWNWDAPLLISKYNNKKLYFAANKLFVSQDFGNSWSVNSPDLSRQIDRNKLPIMEKVWGLKAVAKNQSTSIYGNITFLCEGKEGQLLAGTDDGLVHFTLDDGKTWSLLSNNYPSVNLWTEVSEGKTGKTFETIYPLVSSLNINTKNEFIISLDNHRQGDFKPYLLISSDQGKTWKKLGAGLPDNGAIKSVWIDPKEDDIVCVGTEFGFYISIDKGMNFIPFMKGLPPVAIKDIAFQEREEDLVLATFGRGFVVCDDYQLIREFKKNQKQIFTSNSIHKLFVPYSKLGSDGNAYHGKTRYMGENLDEKLNIYVNIPQDLSSVKKRRENREKEAKPLDLIYPSVDSILAEESEVTDNYCISVYAENNRNSKLIARWNINSGKGWTQTKWNCRYTVIPTNLFDPKASVSDGPYVSPGNYYIGLDKVIYKGIDSCTALIPVKVDYLFDANQLKQEEVEIRNANINLLLSVRTSLIQTNHELEQLNTKLNHLLKITALDQRKRTELMIIKVKYDQVQTLLQGQLALAKYEFETNNGINQSFWNVYYEMLGSLTMPTKTHINTLNSVKNQLIDIQNQVNELRNSLQEF